MASDYSVKIVKFSAGRYAFEVPPVCNAGWDMHAWIYWIDTNGVWL